MRTLTIGATLAASMLVLAACGGEEEAPVDPAVQSPGIETPALDAVEDPAADDPDADVVPGDDDSTEDAEADDGADALVTPVPDEAGD